MREDRRLRPAGGAAGEDEDERVVLGDRRVGERGRRVVGEAGEVALGHEQERRAGLAVEARAALLVHHDQLRVGELEGVAHLGARPPAVHGDEHRVELATAQNVSSHSRQLAAHTATRSPGPMP